MITSYQQHDDDSSVDEMSHLCATTQGEGDIVIKIKSNDSPDIEIAVGRDETIECFKSKVVGGLKIDNGKSRVRLIHCGKLLEPDSKKVIDDFHIPDGAYVHAVVTNKPVSSSRNHTDTSTQASTATDAGNASSEANQANNNLRGIDQLTYAGMTADEVQAIRSSFLPSIDEFAEQRNIRREADESNTAYRFRLEEQWMEEQGPNSEFMMNLPQAAMRYRMIRTLRQLGIAPSRAFAAAGTTGAGGENRAGGGGGGGGGGGTILFEMMQRNGSSSSSAFGTDEDDPGMGTRKDLLWGMFMGFSLGFITLICVWVRNIPYRQKMGILIGVALQILVGLLTGDAADRHNSSASSATPPTSTSPQISPQPVVVVAPSSTSGNPLADSVNPLAATAFFRGSKRY